MKLSCYSKIFFLMLSLSTALFSAIMDKSAIIYYGTNISYPMVGLHNYIIVDPSNITTYTHGFSVYKKKMYAYVSIGEVNSDSKFFAHINKKWILGKNKAWHSQVMDVSNPKYQQFIFTHMIEPQVRRGFTNFFFDTLDSYQLVAKTDLQRKEYEKGLIAIINKFHKKYPNSKLIINRGFEIIDKIHMDIQAVLFESYYYGVGGKTLSYKKVSEPDRTWLDTKIKKIKSYGLDIICVDYLSSKELFTPKADELVKKLKQKGFIPYVSNRELDVYGKSSKNAIKREVLTLINTKTVPTILSSAHEYGALPLEYMGYIQKLYDVKDTLPKMKYIHQYAGVIIWLENNYNNPQKLMGWVNELKKNHIKFVFANSFGFNPNFLLTKLGISVKDFTRPANNKNKIVVQNSMLGYEITPPLGYNGNYLSLQYGKPLFTLSDSLNQQTTLSAIMPWGAYAVDDGFMTSIGNDNIWVINPFKFFMQALRLKPLQFVPDPTTENGKRLLFGHIDGDGFINRVEWNPKLFSAQIILDKILKKYPLPTTVSIVGAEVDPNGLYPKISPQLQNIAKEIYKLPNIEPATHSFSHPFFWQKIHDGNLAIKDRLCPKGYKFSLPYEITGMINQINNKYLPHNKYPKCNMILWSGDCNPKENVLDYVYKHHYLNMNGGDTYITNDHPWLSYIAPYGIEKGKFYQIYTGAQDENVYTNDWKGPFWGYKKVIQTFNHTNTPRRFKPIDIYYHYYTGSKRASLNALKYVYNWAIKQDTMPIFVSDYIPKAMDYYTVSMAKDKRFYLVAGMKNLKTLRLEQQNAYIDMKDAHNVIGYKHFQTHTYIHVGLKDSVILPKIILNKAQAIPYLLSSNGKLIKVIRNKKNINLTFHAYVPLTLEFYLPKECRYNTTKGVKKIIEKQQDIIIKYKTIQEAFLDVRCSR